MKYFSRTATVGALAAVLLLPIAAQADIAPVPRPTTPTAPTAPTTGVSPVVKPVVQPVEAPVKTTVQTDPVQQTPVQHTPVQPTTTVEQPSTPTTTVIVHAVTPAVSSGGRGEELVPVTTTGGRADEEPSTAPAATPAAAPLAPTPKLFPTKLVAVGHEPVPTYDAWPSWVLALLTVLISAEAFLVVRLSRSRPRTSRAPQGISV